MKSIEMVKLICHSKDEMLGSTCQKSLGPLIFRVNVHYVSATQSINLTTPNRGIVLLMTPHWDDRSMLDVLFALDEVMARGVPTSDLFLGVCEYGRRTRPISDYLFNCGVPRWELANLAAGLACLQRFPVALEPSPKTSELQVLVERTRTHDDPAGYYQCATRSRLRNIMPWL